MVRIELVVARYNEKLDWINHEPFQTHKKSIYNKGPPVKQDDLPSCGGKNQFFELPNVGREGHTYLYHIIENYDYLSDVTIFLPGSCMNEHKSYHTTQLVNKVMETNDTAIFGKWYPNVRSNLKSFSINTWKGTSAENNQLSPELNCQPSQIARPFGSWFAHYFPDTVIHVVSYTSMFAVSRLHIHQHTIDHYRSLLASLETHANPEDGHFIERSWVAVFHPIPERCLFAAKPVHAHSSGGGGRGDSVSGSDKVVTKALSGKQSMSSLLSLYAAKSSSVINETSGVVSVTTSSQKPQTDIISASKQSVEHTPITTSNSSVNEDNSRRYDNLTDRLCRSSSHSDRRRSRSRSRDRRDDRGRQFHGDQRYVDRHNDGRDRYNQRSDSSGSLRSANHCEYDRDDDNRDSQSSSSYGQSYSRDRNYCSNNNSRRDRDDDQRHSTFNGNGRYSLSTSSSYSSQSHREDRSNNNSNIRVISRSPPRYTTHRDNSRDRGGEKGRYQS